MRITYNKLVRDRIPEILKAEGKKCSVQVMPEDQFRLALARKLVEESEEAAAVALAGDRAGLIKELADIYEVIDGLMASQAIERAEVLDVQGRRRRERGAFNDRLWLEWVEEPAHL
jgi:predicted house-cleaning noncanonical NTP pyrophosphatase (MazG superfamily)